MYKLILLLIFVSSIKISLAQQSLPITFKNEKDSASYAAGLNEGQRMASMLMEAGADTILNQELFLAGFVDFMQENPQMDPNSAQMVLQTYFGKWQQALDEKKARQDEEIKKIFAVNKDKSEKFLAENKVKKGIITTTSGLQYLIVKKGKGKNIQLGDNIKVRYIGTLLDGTLVDSIPKSEPYEFEFQEGAMIPGWTEVLQLMKNESHFKVYLPYDLAYGEMGKEPQIPPYSVLVFDLEVLGVTPKKK